MIHLKVINTESKNKCFKFGETVPTYRFVVGLYIAKRKLDSVFCCLSFIDSFTIISERWYGNGSV